MLHKNLNFKIDYVDNEYILYLHGWGGNNASLMSVVDTRHTMMSLDFFSSEEEYGRDYDTYYSALDVYLTLKEYGIDTISVVAHSYGGRVAIILASVFNINIKNIVLLSSAGISTIDVIKNIKIFNFKLVKMLTKIGVYSTDILQKYGSQDYKNVPYNLKSVFRNIIRQDLYYLLDNIKVDNVVLIYGSNDKITPCRIARKIAITVGCPCRLR